MFSRVMKLLAVMDEVSESSGLPLPQIALNWCYSQPLVTTCIVGAQKRERVVENARSFDAQLSPEDMRLLNEAVETLHRQ